MKVLLFNSPWYDSEDPMKWGVRGGSRWPHFQERPSIDKLPRYVPFPFFLATSAAVLRRAGHDVKIIDAIASDFKLEQSLAMVEVFKPQVIFSES